MTAGTAEKPTQLNAQKPLVVTIKGKVTRTRRYDGHTFTTIICPAADVYSKPSVVEIRSKSRFAELEDETTCQAVLGGFEGRPFRATDKETGESRQVVPVNLFLDLVE